MRYLSLCSGIEAATVAWRSLGWEAVAFSEIEPFPCAVLAHHYPDVTNLGDMTCIDGTQFTGLVDVLVAGTPCQPFSVAGLREGLSDSRGNLTLKFVELANAIKPSVAVVWENVPGVLSMRDNAFGCFLAGLAGSDGPLVPARPGRWPDAGLVFGPLRAIAWRVLDAQYFGLAQRRRRVFVVACPRNGLNPAEILFEFDGVRRDTPPRREARTDIAETLEARTGRSRRAGTSPGAITSHWEGGVHPCLNQSAHSSGGIGMSDQELFSQRGAGLVPHGYIADVSPTLRAGGNSTGGDRPMGMDVDTCESLVSYVPEIVSQAISCKWSKGTSGSAGDEHHNLVGCISEEQNASTQEKYPSAILRILRQKVGEEAFTEWGLGILDSLQTPEILRQALHGSGIRRAARETGFILDDRPLSCSENLPSGPLRHLWEEGPDGCSSQGRQLAQQLAREFGKALPFLPPHNTPKTALRVRRLTPRETERLQGFPDDYTAIAYRGKPVADSPRYRALGNSMAVPVVRWIGQRIQQWEAAHV